MHFPVPTNGVEWLQAIVAAIIAIPLLIVLVAAAYYVLRGLFEYREWQCKVETEELANLWRSVFRQGMLDKPDGHSREK